MTRTICIALLICFSIGCQTSNINQPGPDVVPKQVDVVPKQVDVVPKQVDVVPKQVNVADKLYKPQQSCFLLRATKINNGKLVSKRGIAVLVSKTKEKKYIFLTALHVINGSNKFYIKSFSNSNIKAKTELKKLVIDEETDLALMELESETKLDVAPIKYGKISLGTDIFAFGQPSQGIGLISKGIISGYIDKERNKGIMITDATILKGFSGGAVFNDQNHLIGIVTAITESKIPLGFIMPIDKAKCLIDQKENKASN